jgi:hypothetical protein
LADVSENRDVPAAVVVAGTPRIDWESVIVAEVTVFDKFLALPGKGRPCPKCCRRDGKLFHAYCRRRDKRTGKLAYPDCPVCHGARVAPSEGPDISVSSAADAY